MAIIGDKREIVRINFFFAMFQRFVFQLRSDTAAFISFKCFNFIFKPLNLFIHQTPKT